MKRVLTLASTLYVPVQLIKTLCRKPRNAGRRHVAEQQASTQQRQALALSVF
jgi:hypothetical protein